VACLNTQGTAATISTDAYTRVPFLSFNPGWDDWRPEAPENTRLSP